MADSIVDLSTRNESAPHPGGDTQVRRGEEVGYGGSVSPRNGGHLLLGQLPNSVRHLPRLAQQSAAPFQGFACVFGADGEAGEFLLTGFIDEKIFCIQAS